MTSDAPDGPHPQVVRLSFALPPRGDAATLDRFLVLVLLLVDLLGSYKLSPGVCVFVWEVGAGLDGGAPQPRGCTAAQAGLGVSAKASWGAGGRGAAAQPARMLPVHL